MVVDEGNEACANERGALAGASAYLTAEMLLSLLVVYILSNTFILSLILDNS